MKIAYIILAHKLPQQIIRLVNRLNTDDTSFLIHVDKKTEHRIYQEIVRDSSDHPEILTSNNFKSINQSSSLFARKFDISQDSKILDLIDKNILDI